MKKSICFVVALFVITSLSACGGLKGIKGVFVNPDAKALVDNLLEIGNKDACKSLSDADKALIASELSIVLNQKVDPALMCK